MRKTISGFFKIEDEKIEISPLRFSASTSPTTTDKLTDILPIVNEEFFEEKEKCLSM